MAWVQAVLPGPRAECFVDGELGDAELFMSHFLFDGVTAMGDLWRDAAWVGRIVWGLLSGRGAVRPELPPLVEAPGHAGSVV